MHNHTCTPTYSRSSFLLPWICFIWCKSVNDFHDACAVIMNKYNTFTKHVQQAIKSTLKSCFCKFYELKNTPLFSKLERKREKKTVFWTLLCAMAYCIWFVRIGAPLILLLFSSISLPKDSASQYKVHITSKQKYFHSSIFINMRNCLPMFQKTSSGLRP